MIWGGGRDTSATHYYVIGVKGYTWKVKRRAAPIVKK